MNKPKHHILVKLAQSREELEGAFKLLQEGHCDYGFAEKRQGLWINKHHALPSTSTFVAMEGKNVVGAICLFGESPFHLPLDSCVSLEKLRTSMKGRLAEISAYALDTSVKDKEEVAYSLFHYAVCFSAIFCHHDLLITCAPEPLEPFYKDKLGFSPFLSAPIHGKVMTLHVLEIADYTQALRGDVCAEFEFPEKKFHLVNHHVMHPELLDYFFNRMTHVFDELNDMELRSIRNIYNFGNYASVLPKRESAISFPRLPQHKRFEMHCEGYLLLPNQERVSFRVYDVSAKGLKIEIDEDQELKSNTVYMLKISIGILKDTEVIARSIWVKRDLNQVGLEVQSADQGWQKLIHYLETDFHQSAA